MPYLKIHTNSNIPDKADLLASASTAVAQALGKPESYVMVQIDSETPMSFAGSTAPLAYLELKSIGLPEDNTAAISSQLCTMIKDKLNIEPDRVYIEFANAARHMWGWKGATF